MTLATGGTVADANGYRVHTFNSSTDLIVSVAGNVDYLLVGGGGGTGRTDSTSACSGGGGGGAVKTGVAVALGVATFPVVIGGGGAGFQTVGSAGAGTSGTASTFNSVTAGGGGLGAQNGTAGGNGVNGGNGGGGGTSFVNGTDPAGGTSDTGFAGGAGFGNTSNGLRSAGGGGGASAIGTAAASAVGGNGGAGASNSLSGAAVTYGAGGGGGSSSTGATTPGSAGDSSAAAGLRGAGFPNAVANRGGGGGGNVGIAAGGGGNGGSGLCIVRYIAPLTVTDSGDELYNNGDAVTVTGTNFLATQGTGRVVISPTDNIADGGAVTQTVTLWGNTSINITVVRGSLTPGATCYLFVENDLDASNAAGWAVAFNALTIADAGDELYASGGDPYTITGTTFFATQGAGSVLVSPTDNVNDAGAITQGVSSWSDTSINATSVQAGLMSGVTLYLFVKNSDNISNAAGWPVQFTFEPVTITNAGDELYVNGDAVTITGTQFISLQGAGFVVISPTDDITDPGAVTQTVTSWSSTSIGITAVQGALPLATPLFLFVENNVGTSNLAGFPVQFETAPVPVPSEGGVDFIQPIEFIGWIE